MPTTYGPELSSPFWTTVPGRVLLRGAELVRRRNVQKYSERNSLAVLAADIDRHGRKRRDAIRRRLRTLLDAVGATANPATTEQALRELITALTPLDQGRAWLMLAVIAGRLPRAEEVSTAVRNAEADGMVSALRLAIWSGPLARVLDTGRFREIEFVRDAVLVDVHHTAQVSFATGIQRVTREAARRWAAHHPVVFVGWHDDQPALRRLTPPEIRRACWGGASVVDPESGPVLIPLNCTYLLPELATEEERTEALLCLGEHSSTRIGLIGYDMCPITVPETCGPDMPAAFARNLAAIKHARAIATISEAAAVEYRGWSAMLRQIGLPGPSISACLLPNEGAPTSPESMASAADRLLLGRLPMVLVVGSHEPRKNHLAVLHAAELLWREGLQFSLTFIGGNSWNGERFGNRLAELQTAGRPVETISAASDEQLWAAYHLARFTVFPSLNEGFGLPIVESIASGTPVITSDFGSMKEIAATGGALLVDPRSDRSIADAMRRLLVDDQALAELVEQARSRPERTWDEYAAQTWKVLTAHE